MYKSFVRLILVAAFIIGTGTLVSPVLAEEPEPEAKSKFYCMSNRSPSVIQWRDGGWRSQAVEKQTTLCVNTDHSADVEMFGIDGSVTKSWGHLAVSMEAGCVVVNDKGNWCISIGKSKEDCIRTTCTGSVTKDQEQEQAKPEPEPKTYCVSNRNPATIFWRDGWWRSKRLEANKTECVVSDHVATVELYEVDDKKEYSWGLATVSKNNGCMVVNGPSSFCIHEAYTKEQCIRAECSE